MPMHDEISFDIAERGAPGQRHRHVKLPAQDLEHFLDSLLALNEVNETNDEDRVSNARIWTALK